MIGEILRNVLFGRAYYNVVVIFSQKMEEQPQKLAAILRLLFSYKLKMKVSKVAFAKEEVDIRVTSSL